MEECGLIQSVGEWVLEQACEHAMRWNEMGLKDLSVAVNLSVRQLRQGDMATRIAAILEKTRLPASQLELGNHREHLDR